MTDNQQLPKPAHAVSPTAESAALQNIKVAYEALKFSLPHDFSGKPLCALADLGRAIIDAAKPTQPDVAAQHEEKVEYTDRQLVEHLIENGWDLPDETGATDYDYAWAAEEIAAHRTQAVAEKEAECAKYKEALQHIRDFSVMGIGLESPGSYTKDVARKALQNTTNKGNG